jgi:diguanylate cyclase (GGDEF)-like protein
VKFFRSLGVRIYGVAVLTVMVALMFGMLSLQRGSSSQDAFEWVNHTQRVIISLEGVEANLREAESDLRGYLLTRDASYVSGFDANLAKSTTLVNSLPELVADNPPQALRAIRLKALVTEKADIMAIAVQRRLAGVIDARPDADARQRGREAMTAVTRQTAIMRDEEHRLLAERTITAENKAAEAKALLLYGCPVIALLIGCLAWLIRSSISRPLANLLDVVTRFGAGDRDARAATETRSVEFKRLAIAYNDMAAHLVSAMDQQSRTEGQLARANAELIERAAALELRQQSALLISEMSHRLQAIQSEGELSEVLDCFLPQVLPDLAGVLYLHNHSRNMLMPISRWGDVQASAEMFPPADCWGLRRGQSHLVVRPGADLICPHAASASPVERLCEPILAGGEVLGLLYLEGSTDGESRFRLGMLMENVALALVNENLRSRLREQSIRDPLTKLFNRRYMEEALALETARAERSSTPLSLIMCDVDHFKRFNDTHGHEAGDLLLTAVAALIHSHFRHGDIVCRYGGEEFTVIAPGTSAAIIHERLDALRLAIRELTVGYNGQKLGPVTMSFGVDSWVAGEGTRLDQILGEADRALFRAKRLGRDRIEFASETLVPLTE